MYIEHTPQGYNIMGMSPVLLTCIIEALRECYSLEDCPKIQDFVSKAEYELKNKRFLAMTTAVYRYCSNPYSIPKLYSNTRCEVLGFSGRRVKIKLLEFSRGHRPGDVMRVLRRNVHITGLAPNYMNQHVNMENVRLPYKD